MNMSGWIVVLLVAGLALGVVGCPGATEPESSKPATEVVTPTPLPTVPPPAASEPGDADRPPAPATAEELAELVAGNNDFAWRLYQHLVGGSEPVVAGNSFFSPYSLSTALALAYVGAEAETEAEMASTLGWTLPEPRVHAAWKQLQDDLNAAGAADYELRVANALWGQQDSDILSSYVERAQRYYAAGMRLVDFMHATEAARQTINRWVAQQTNDKIKDLIAEGVLKPSTVLVLTNAIYFKGKWVEPFDPELTEDAPFFLAEGEPATAPLMTRKGSYAYAEQEDCQVVELPYGGDQLSMVVFLPAAGTPLATFERTLTAARVQALTGALRRQEVVVFLPRFQMSAKFALGPVLAAMGMERAFSSRADFSGINGKRDLFLSAVIHQAYVDVNEEGTEAAAATGVVIERLALPAPPKVFRADRPFVFVIRDRQSGSVLFVGRVTDPTA